MFTVYENSLRVCLNTAYLLKIYYWKYCSKIIFKSINSAVGPKNAWVCIFCWVWWSHEQCRGTKKMPNAIETLGKHTLRGCLVCVFKQSFSVFKQYFTHFNTLFHPHVFPQIFLNNNFQFLNTRTKRTLSLHLNCMPSIFQCTFDFLHGFVCCTQDS